MGRLREIAKRSPLGTMVRFGRRLLHPPLPENDDRLALRIVRRALREGGHGVDIGAHAGLFLAEMCRRSPKGTHLAFEPLPHFAAGLKERFPSARVFELALSDRAGRVEFTHFPTLQGFSGLRRRTDLPPEQPVRRIEVETARLDDVLAKAALPEGWSPAVVKIDVEGAELSVLHGARQLLERARPLLILEHGLGPLEVYGTTPEDVYQLLVSELGYRLSTYPRHLAGKPTLSREEFAAIVRGGKVVNFVATPR